MRLIGLIGHISLISRISHIDSDSIRLIIACLLDGLLLSERFGEEALGRGLSVVVVVAVADRLIVFGDGALALRVSPVSAWSSSMLVCDKA